MYGENDAARLKKEIITPRFAVYLDICAREHGQHGTSSYSPIPTPTNTAALESVWSSLSRVASSNGYTPPATDIVITTTITTVVPTTRPGGLITSASSTYTTTIPNPVYFPPSVTTVSPTSSSTSSPTQEPGSERSSAWIAGPVVGGIAGMILIAALFGFFVIRRRRHAQRDPRERTTVESIDEEENAVEKAQLHSDHISPPSELPGVTYYWSRPAEVGADAPPVELPADGAGTSPK